MSGRTLTLGLVQLTTTDDPEASIAAALAGVERAAKGGATFVALPENVPFMGPEKRKLALAEPLDGPTFRRFADAAARFGVVLAAGTFVERGPDPRHVYNTSVIYGPDGGALAVYRKIHLFDVGDLGDGFAYAESTSVAPGDRAVVVDTPAARVGASVCFDLRFPELYRALAERGAEILLVPSAFTRPTGAAHWSVLLRARAIETQCFVVAAAQTGDNTQKRRTYGHSMVVDPWGRVLLELGDAPEVATVTIDLDAIGAARAKVPTAANRRPFRP
jgi:predicted amidohydrolase